MIWYENVPRVAFDFVDREGTKASLDLHFALDSDRDSLWSAIKLETRFLPLTACTFCGRSLTVGAALDGAPAPIGSNLVGGYLMLISDQDTYTSLLIPGLRADLLLLDGCFAEQKIDMLHPDVVALNLALISNELVTERGDSVLAVSSGGRMNVWADLSQRSG